jgi:hypothetical protein
MSEGTVPRAERMTPLDLSHNAIKVRRHLGVVFAAALEQTKAIKTSIISTRHPILNGGDLLGMGYGALQKITVAYRDFLDAAPFINITTAHSPSRIGLSPS